GVVLPKPYRNASPSLVLVFDTVLVIVISRELDRMAAVHNHAWTVFFLNRGCCGRSGSRNITPGEKRCNESGGSCRQAGGCETVPECGQCRCADVVFDADRHTLKSACKITRNDEPDSF